MGASSSLPAAPAQKREQPCQDEFDAYMRCTSTKNMTVDMTDCENIAIDFKKCMERSVQSKELDAERDRLPEASPGHAGRSSGSEDNSGRVPVQERLAAYWARHGKKAAGADAEEILAGSTGKASASTE
eukprot:TRINITY_DN80108_c0_g1_i1.p1 TRINITY_DN80108_c0_g1~~TRINITY_DN80108_c0_g1_i1.p1  ORF type:complete len:139 (+),score=38.93 TRINITY_DN80108_c0_g1_i1:31-417(+)